MLVVWWPPPRSQSLSQLSMCGPTLTVPQTKVQQRKTESNAVLAKMRKLNPWTLSKASTLKMLLSTLSLLNGNFISMKIASSSIFHFNIFVFNISCSSNTFVSSTTTNTTNSDNDIESNVFKVKRRRSTNATSIKRTLGPSSTSTQLSTEVFLESDYLSSTSSTLLSTTAAPNVPQIVRKVEDLEITFTDLEHFSEYTVEVQACQDFDPTAHERNAQPCSMTAIATVRTLSLRTYP